MDAEHSSRFAGQPPGQRIVKDIRRATRKQYSAEEKIRIVEVVAEQALELRLLKKSMIADGESEE